MCCTAGLGCTGLGSLCEGFVFTQNAEHEKAVNNATFQFRLNKIVADREQAAKRAKLGEMEKFMRAIQILKLSAAAKKEEVERLKKDTEIP